MVRGGPWWYRNFARIGYVGVNFFFVLSGFILVYNYSDPNLSARRFWQARFAPFYPAYILSLVVTAPFFFNAVHQSDIPFLLWSKQHLTAACLLTVGLLQVWIPQAAKHEGPGVEGQRLLMILSLFANKLDGTDLFESTFRDAENGCSPRETVSNGEKTVALFVHGLGAGCIMGCILEPELGPGVRMRTPVSE